jgi:hypothetical protein
VAALKVASLEVARGSVVPSIVVSLGAGLRQERPRRPRNVASIGRELATLLETLRSLSDSGRGGPTDLSLLRDSYLFGASVLIHDIKNGLFLASDDEPLANNRPFATRLYEKLECDFKGVGDDGGAALCRDTYLYIQQVAGASREFRRLHEGWRRLDQEVSMARVRVERAVLEDTGAAA